MISLCFGLLINCTKLINALILLPYTHASQIQEVFFVNKKTVTPTFYSVLQNLTIGLWNRKSMESAVVFPSLWLKLVSTS